MVMKTTAFHYNYKKRNYILLIQHTFQFVEGNFVEEDKEIYTLYKRGSKLLIFSAVLYATIIAP